jgi:glucose-6-phosphate isomerase
VRVDLGNALTSEASPGIARAGLERLDEQVTRAHERIEAGRENGEFGYAALDLPETADPAAIRSRVERFRDAEAVLTVGIGGSGLPAATITQALADIEGERPPVHVLDNVDPEHVDGLLAELPLADTAVNVVSRSGSTAETLANFLVVREEMERAGVDWTDRTLVTTGSDGPLRRLAERHDLPVLDAPEEVPGRFSALSTVGLAAAAIQGHDLEAILDGARKAARSLTGSLFECPAYAYGTAAYALDQRGASANVLMPYAECLETFGEWFGQLWAESLGKDGVGQTPMRAVGATDQHARLQLFRGGPREHLVTFVAPQERVDREIPAQTPEGVEYLGGKRLGTLLDAELSATEASLAAAGRPNVRIEVQRLDERSVGELLYGMQAACILAGELYGVETFNQPAVEWGKLAAKGLLGAEEGTEEAASVGRQETLLIE